MGCCEVEADGEPCCGAGLSSSDSLDMLTRWWFDGFFQPKELKDVDEES